MAEKSSYATYLVEGLNTEKNLNFLCGNGICLYEVKKNKQKTILCDRPLQGTQKVDCFIEK